MKSFLKMILACLVALFISGIVSVFFYTCTFVGIMSALSEDETASTKTGDVFFLKINGEVHEVPPSVPFDFSMLGGFSMKDSPSLRGICAAIDVAAVDDNVKGIYLNTDGMTAAPATYEAIRDRLTAFRNTGKWIVAYNDNYSLGQYYIATAADSIYVNPIGSVTLDGMTSTTPYFKGLLDKLGIEMQIFRVGTFKAAVEPYILEHMSEANRKQISDYMNSIWGSMAAEMAESRGIGIDTINALADEAVSYMLPDELMQTGLIDRQVYRSEMEDILKARIGKDNLSGLTIKALASNYNSKFGTHISNEVAVLYATGEIVSSKEDISTGEGIYWLDLIEDIKELRENEKVKAVVLRVNSPGGSGFASEQIWKALCELREEKPLVVSMGDYAASGGYYISAPAHAIVAETTTLTGSIGVFGMIPNYSGLASGKLGVNFEEVKTHKMGSVSAFRKVSDAERVKVQKGIDAFYDLFLTRCSEGRGISKDSIAMVAEGRVWTGAEAQKLGLVDVLGDLGTAVQLASQLANLEADDYATTWYPAAEKSWTKLLKSFDDDVQLQMTDRVMGTDRAAIDFIRHLKNADRIQARAFDSIEL